MEKAIIRFVRPDQVPDQYEAAIDVTLPDEFKEADVLEQLEYFRALIEMGGRQNYEANPEGFLLDRLARFREVVSQARSVLRDWGDTMITASAAHEHRPKINALIARISEHMFRDETPPAAGHVVRVEIVLTPEQWERVRLGVRVWGQTTAEAAVDLLKATGVESAGAVGLSDYDLQAPAVDVEPSDADVQLDLRTWFEAVTGWEIDPEPWDSETLESVVGFRDGVEAFKLSREGSPELVEANVDEETIYREAMSSFKIPVPLRESVQSFRHSGRRPK